ncbi:MAG: archaeosortase/exosortase family protein [Candidatus Hydrogenedentes bacterium]|nr:archaeosortase/exosortase family protein [Candidatus Hydrogenedentota bacterium]
MILVTVGAQMPFDRLVAAVDQWAGERNATGIFAQVGNTAYLPKHIEFEKFVAPEKLRELVEAADVIVAHAGMGTILTALELGKPIVVMPRRGVLRETRNDHQVATARQFGDRGLISVAWDEHELALRLDTELNRLKATDRISRQASPELCRAISDFIERPRKGKVDGIVCFGGVDWWYHNRGHYDVQMMRELSRDMPVVYVNSIGMRTPRVGEGRVFIGRVARKVKSWGRGLKVVSENFAVLSPVSIPKFHQTSLARALLIEQVRDAAEYMGISSPLLWVACPPAAEVFEKIPAAGLVYQRTDRFEHYPGVDPARIRAYDLTLKQSADVTLFCSTSVYESETSECRSALFVDHGVDFDQFEAAGRGATTEPNDVRDIPRPRIGFVGGIDAHTFDPELFLSVARAMPNCSFVLVGGCSLPEEWCDLSNVYMLGRKPYTEVAAYMAACDVLIMPWNQNAWIKACNPVKLKEYLAVGRPIVSTPFDELSKYEAHVEIAEDAQQFVAHIQRVLENPGDPAPRRARVKQETWSVKAASVVEGVQQAGVGFRKEAVPTRAGRDAVLKPARVKPQNPGTRQLDARQYWRPRYFIAACALVLASMWITSDAYWDVWRLLTRDLQSSFGLIAIPAAAWLIWTRRESALLSRRSGTIFAPIIAAAGWILYSIGDAQLIQSFWYMGAVTITIACAVSVLGTELPRRLWPALLVLMFAIPIPGLIQLRILQPIQDFTARSTAVVLHFVGESVSLDSRVMQINGVSVDVAQAFGGVGIIFALTLVCLTFAFSARVGTRMRVFLVLTSPVLAFALNTVRLIPTAAIYGYLSLESANRVSRLSDVATLPAVVCGLAAMVHVARWIAGSDFTAKSGIEEAASPASAG